MNTDGATDRTEEWCAALRTAVTAATRTARLGTPPPTQSQGRNRWVNGPEPRFPDAPAQNDVRTAVNDRQLGDRNRRSEADPQRGVPMTSSSASS
jgi:hypothetical protein